MTTRLPFGFSVRAGEPDGNERRFYIHRNDEHLAYMEVSLKLRPDLMAFLKFDPDEGDTTLGLGTPLAWVFLVVDGCPLKHPQRERELGLRITIDQDSALYDLAMRADLWVDPHRWSSDEPGWRRPSVRLLDVLFGKPIHEEVLLEERQVNIPFPEGPCPAVVKLTRSTWRRPRGPYQATIRRAVVAALKPPVIPGKGENGYDLDDDALYEITCPADSIEHAAAQFLASVLRDRQTRAGTWNYPGPQQPPASPLNGAGSEGAVEGDVGLG